MFTDDDVVKVSIVGAGMMTNPVCTRMFQALTEADIPVFVVSTSEIKVSCLVPRARHVDAYKPCTENLSFTQEMTCLFAENMVSL